MLSDWHRFLFAVAFDCGPSLVKPFIVDHAFCFPLGTTCDDSNSKCLPGGLNAAGGLLKRYKPDTFAYSTRVTHFLLPDADSPKLRSNVCTFKVHCHLLTIKLHDKLIVVNANC